MKCYACGSSHVESAMSRCPECGFPLIHTVGDAAGQEARMEKMADEYRKKKLGDIKLGMLSYFHEMQQGHLVQSAIEEISFPAPVCDVVPGGILWQEQKFASIDGGETITVTLILADAAGKRQVELPMTAPETEGFWQVGFMLEPGFVLRLAVGNPKSYNLSDKVPLVR